MGFSFTIISLDGGRNQSDKGANLEVHNQQMRKCYGKPPFNMVSVKN